MNTQTPDHTHNRHLAQVIPALETSDGAGVRLRRSIGSQPGLRLDPFLMLDAFGTDDPDDYIAGFPSHPHRGFETVTYMLDGHMQHRDHLGNVGDLGPGGVQWMSAGRGVIHSEMPQQTHGRMRGFQLWINLPAAEKMKPAHYRDIPSEQIPVLALPGGGQIKVVAGHPRTAGVTIEGPINTAATPLTTDPLYLDVRLPAGATLAQPLTPGYNAFVYVYEGTLAVGTEAEPLGLHAAGVLDVEGNTVTVTAGTTEARFLLLAARPLREPVAQYGPFVMNTREEIEQAMRDYQTDRLV